MDSLINLGITLISILVIAIFYYFFHALFFGIFNLIFGIKERKIWLTKSDFFYAILTLVIWMFSYLLVNLKSQVGWLEPKILHDNIFKVTIFSIIIFFAIDLIEYGIHFAYHKVSWLWKFHKVHHEPTSLNWPKAIRLSLFEAFTTSFIINCILLFFFGNNYLLIISIAFSIKRFYGLFLHSNTDLDYGFLSSFISSPRFHHWHHSISVKQPANLSNLLSIWDKIFGTFYGEGSEIPKEYGIKPEEKQ